MSATSSISLLLHRSVWDAKIGRGDESYDGGGMRVGRYVWCGCGNFGPLAMIVGGDFVGGVCMYFFRRVRLW